MSYQTSHDVGVGSFRPNKDRGFWSSPHDFALACLNNAFRIDNIYGIAIVPIIISNGFPFILLWFFSTILYAIPIFFIQSFLGQFSSSGYISALRISPLFKGLGYIGLAMNLISLAFHSVLIAVPLLFLIHSLQPTLPWSCEAHHPWKDNVSISSNMSTPSWTLYKSHCDVKQSTETDEFVQIVSIPSVEFFQHKLSDFNLDIFGCVLIVWAAMAYVTYQSSEKIGIFFRYCTITAMSLLVIVFVRMLFLPGILSSIGLSRQYYPTDSWIMTFLMSVITTFLTFGPGWGSVLSLASYNKFKTDIVRYSWQIPICQLGILMLLGMLADIAELHLIRDTKNVIQDSTDLQWLSFMTIPTTLASMDYPHLWTWMFLIMIVLGFFNLTLTQMFSIQTAVLDEFEQLRPFRKELIFGCAAVLALISALFCTTKGLNVIEMVVDLNLFSQCFLNLLLVFVVLWVYGRDRFQRDVKFMTNEVLLNWKLNYVRFVAPIFITIMAIMVSGIGVYYHSSSPEFEVICYIVTFSPWVALPAYCVYRLRQASGDWKLRLTRCIRPTDWFPVDPEDRQRYDETFDNQDMTHTLTAVS